MNRLCPKAIQVCRLNPPGEPDWPVLNLSSEAPDGLLFAGTGYAPFDPYRPAPLGDGQFYARDCNGVQYSVQSQDLANLLARVDSVACAGGDQQYANDAQTGFSRCGNGGLFFYTVPAGTFISPLLNAQDGAAWVAASNAYALAYAQKQAASISQKCCIANPRLSGASNVVPCAQALVAADNTYTVTGQNAAADYTFSVINGTLPPGTHLVKTSHNTAQLQGIPTTSGAYTFTVQATRSDLYYIYAQAVDTVTVSSCLFPLAWWTMENTPAIPQTDSVGSAPLDFFSGIAGCASKSAGLLREALDLDTQDNQAIDLRCDSAQIKFNGVGVTVCFWLNCTVSTPGALDYPGVTYTWDYDPIQPDPGIGIIRPNGGNYQVIGTGTGLLMSRAAPGPGWHFFVLTYDRASGMVGFDIDQAGMTDAFYTIHPEGTYTYGILDLSSQALTVPSRVIALFDEVAVFPGVLTAAQLDYLYNSGTGRTYPLTP